MQGFPGFIAAAYKGRHHGIFRPGPLEAPIWSVWSAGQCVRGTYMGRIRLYGVVVFGCVIYYRVRVFVWMLVIF